MRLSLRKVVRLATFLVLLLILNVWISYNVNFYSFDDRGKVLQTWRREGDHGQTDEARLLKFERSVDDIDGSSGTRPIRSTKQVNADNERDSSARSQQFVNETGEKELVAPVKGSDLLLTTTSRRGGSNPKQGGTGPKSQKNLQIRVHKDSDKTELKDIFISVKTTSKYHGPRVKLLLKTWYLLAREQVYFFTDGNDTEIAEILGDHLINTNCSTDHSRRALSCKMAVEFDYYMASRKRWFCHVDDDVYLNVPRLVDMLQGYNHREDWYLGKPSLKHPLEVADRETPGMKLTFWFATGGAGFCISRSLALKMAPYAGGGRFMTTAETIRLPDDCTLGYIVEHLLKHKLTVVEEFHSHLEALWLIKPHQLDKQITLSFSEYSGKQNVINVQGFSETEDPTRFRSLHCFLFPNFRECRVLS
ncbi:unnamed protein product [Candidula unifasciata]|uniref:Fringe-like glycosyltransferase domain-containing protein n=1 Tax=Candidula unifasciata TaxID=100452 RepID=A0A8S3ZNL1_9EUPU|nr:unnamed protein product [Candidula unifasciata]